MAVNQTSNPEVDAPVIIGVVGGVGSGKSTAAACLERLGCVVIDSDSRAKAKLDHPAVRETLSSWWGPEVIGDDGRIDRRRVASIVFSDPAERRRLEELIHPMLAGDRESTIREAALAGAPGVVIDAPLLLEAGLDAECDAILFVDAPLERRLRQVKSRQGWDRTELERRESAQMALEKKREAADHVVSNAGTTDDLCVEVSRVFREILGKASRRSIQS